MKNKNENMDSFYLPERDRDKERVSALVEIAREYMSKKTKEIKDSDRPYYMPVDNKSIEKPYYYSGGNEEKRYTFIPAEPPSRRERWLDDDNFNSDLDEYPFDDDNDDDICDTLEDDESEEKRYSRSILSQEGNVTDNDCIRNAISEAHRSGNIILPDGSLVSSDGYITRVNNNIIVLGTSGGGKTRSVVIPNILAANESMIISDPKGSLYEQYGEYLESYGYRVSRLDLITPEHSDFYNPLEYTHTSDEVMRLAHQICYADGPAGGNYDPFWDKADELLMTALIAYLTEKTEIDWLERGRKNISEVIRLLEKINANEMEEEHTCSLDKDFETHRRIYKQETQKDSWAYRQWIKFRQTPDNTLNSILITANAALASLDTQGIQRMMKKDNMMMNYIGEYPTAIFVEISDTDRSKDLLANVFYSQAMTELCRLADEQPDHRLKRPVRFILDDFGTTSRIEGFENMISNIRSRGISAMIVLQSLSQLVRGYGQSSHTIIDNCDTLLYMGGNDVDTAEYVSRRSNKSLKSILTMPVGKHWQFRRGQDAKYCDTVDLSAYSFKAKEAGISKE